MGCTKCWKVLRVVEQLVASRVVLRSIQLEGGGDMLLRNIG
jgi:hypothetical protein